ncbi:hypothetical protein GCM10027073_71610 [Streptomyces chlorus]|uniref:Uncharacterized protein n=1 Tax=Streptomyces chlorus TaxID=887452 RepID=A0ABW1DSQ7_9ACTN
MSEPELEPEPEPELELELELEPVSEPDDPGDAGAGVEGAEAAGCEPLRPPEPPLPEEPSGGVVGRVAVPESTPAPEPLEFEPVRMPEPSDEGVVRDGDVAVVGAPVASSGRVLDAVVGADTVPVGCRCASSSGAGCEGRSWERCVPGGLTDGAGPPYWSAGPSAPPMPDTSGAVAAWARSPESRSIEARVSPPPTKATAVATRARRWVFFQRATCRRRAARPVGADITGAGTDAGVDTGSGTSTVGTGPVPIPVPAAVPEPAAGAVEVAVPGTV